MRRDGFGIRAVSAEGHSGFAEKGSDIVCAAVSSLMQALLVGLEEVLGIEDVKKTFDPDAPRMSFEWDSSAPGTQIVAGTIAKSLEILAASYPDRVKYREIK